MTECRSVAGAHPTAHPALYFPADMSFPEVARKLAQNCGVDLEHLPIVIHHIGEIDVNKIHPHGLLYLEHPYIVPGGMFNEMYGWDSYFIIRGLLRAGKTDLARGMVENFFFEIDHYGGVLNANRTYFLTRSQPPFLTSMILAVDAAEKSQGHEDPAWLRKAYDYAQRDYELWTHEPHLAGATGLARYFDFGNGPAPELGDGATAYYRGVAKYFLLHPREAPQYLARVGGMRASGPNLLGPQFTVYVCSGEPASSNCDETERDYLTGDFYKGDRSIRESGFDITFAFGPYGAGTHHYASVALNSLLYKEEKDLEEIATRLGKPEEARAWAERAGRRRAAIDQYLWDASRGLYFNYDFTTGQRSSYVYASTFYPLWAGVASPEQARAVEQNLKLFEQPGGLAMSQIETGAQWDYPYGWAPVTLVALEGLRRYGFNEDANRVSEKFLATVLENFRREKTIREKYNVVTRSAETHVVVGYSENQVGFGWTNGVFLEFLHSLPKEWAERLAAGK